MPTDPFDPRKTQVATPPEISIFQNPPVVPDCPFCMMLRLPAWVRNRTSTANPCVPGSRLARSGTTWSRADGAAGAVVEM